MTNEEDMVANDRKFDEIRAGLDYLREFRDLLSHAKDLESGKFILNYMIKVKEKEYESNEDIFNLRLKLFEFEKKGFSDY